MTAIAQKNAYTLAELAAYLKAEIKGDSTLLIHGLAPLQTASPGEISFLDNPLYAKYLSDTKASAVIISAAHVTKCSVNAIVVENPYLSYAKVAALYDSTPKPSSGVHISAIIDPSCKIHPTASVGPFCVIGANVSIDKDVIIGPSCSISDDCHIGEGTRLLANVTLYHKVRMGKQCLIHSGVVIGSDGFGIVKDKEQWQRIAQIGGVKIGDRVDIGANTTVDRGAINDTVIEDGVKIDNQVQIAHNVRIGSNTAIAGCTGVAGSTVIGKDCIIGGAVAINGHIQITDKVMIAGAAAIVSSIKKPGVYSSVISAQPNHQWRKNHARLQQLDDMGRRLKAIEKILGASSHQEVNQEDES